jgi:hypothetical protein
MLTPEQQAVVDYKASNPTATHAAVGEALGITRKAARNRWDRAQLWLSAPQGQRDAILHSGLDVGIAKAGWRKVKNADGTRDSVYWRAADDKETAPEDMAERIAEKMNNIRPAPAIKRPVVTSSKFRNFIPLFDVHLSMRIGSYGTADAVDRLRNGITDLTERLPPAECTIILNGGDFSEQNDPSNQTPQSKHPLAVDAEYDDTTDVAVESTAQMIEQGLKHSDHVIYKALRGNHDPHTARILRAAMKQRYRNETRVTIDSEGIEFFCHDWAGNFIGGHHGDLKRNAKDIALGFANKYAPQWGRTVYRDLWTGHLHHGNEKDETGMRMNQVRAVSPAGRHSLLNLYQSHSEMIAIAYREGGGWYDKKVHGFPLLDHETG